MRTIQNIADIVSVSSRTVQVILTFIRFEYAPHRYKVCAPTFMSRIITGDETWDYGYEPETKQQSKETSKSSGRAQHLKDRKKQG